MAIDALFVPRISARMNERGESVWAQDFPLISDVPPLRYSCLCPIAARMPLSVRVTRHEKATRIQSLWRGYKTRKTIQERNAEEVKAVLPIWRFYDEDYNRSLMCQTLMVELKKDDPTWDATQTRHYQWMLKTGGPFLEECETYMRRRGWVRPKKKNIHVRFTVTALYRVMEECGVRDTDPRALAALVKTFERSH